MDTKWDERRRKVKEIAVKEPEGLLEIILAIIDELEKLSNELHQGYTKPE